MPLNNEKWLKCKKFEKLQKSWKKLPNISVFLYNYYNAYYFHAKTDLFKF